MDVTVVGSCNIDLVCYVPRFPKAGETLIGSKFINGYGGKGANPCVVAARLGAKVAMISKVGEDNFGKDYKENLLKNNVDISHLGSTSEAGTGVAPIFVNDDGENAIAVVPGANELLSEDDISAAEELIKNCKVVMCQLEIKPSVTLAALKLAKRHNVRSIFNLAPAQSGLPEEYFTVCDILVVNESEAELVTGLSVSNLKEAESASLALLDKGCNVGVITLGENGAVYSTKADRETVHVPTPKVKPVDTTGAGDAFCGSLGFYLATMPELGLKESIRRANVIAGFSVQAKGTQTSYAWRKDLPENLFAPE